MKMRVAYIPRPHKNKTYRYPFIVQSYRNDEGKPSTRTIMNLSALPEHVVNAIAAALRCDDIADTVSVTDIRFEDALDFGHVWGVWRLMEQLGIAELLELLPRQHRHAIAAMIVDRVVNPLPFSKRALHDDFAGSPLARILDNPATGGLNDWYEALESLLKNQPAIEKALFPHGGERIFLYDITSSYFEGTRCPLAAFGYNRDGKKGKMQIVIGLMCNSEGRPVSAQVFEGNTADQSVVMSQVIERYSRLDGCYVITSNIEPDRMETAEVVARYKSLQQVEKAFRSMKTTDLFVRPIHHWNADRVKGHVFVCMLAYLVIHEARRRLEPFLKRDPHTRECQGDSLREIWKTLSGVKIGVLKIGAKTVEQLNSLTALQKQLLKSLGAPLNKKEQERLSLRN